MTDDDSIHLTMATLKARVLPRDGDKVIIQGLQSATELNGKTGTVEYFLPAKRRYRVTLSDTNGGRDLSVKLSNLAVVREDNNNSLHVLVPCHISSERRLALFARCARSVAHQVHAGFSVFIGISGPSEFRNQTLGHLAMFANKAPTIPWYVQDEEVETRPQMEHLRHLLQDSLKINRQALLMFLDNDDMAHPLRFFTFHNWFKEASLPEDSAMDAPCKLLLDADMSPSEGEFEKFVNVRDVKDFNHWKKAHGKSKKVTLATNSQAWNLDAAEYFDFIVPSAVLEKFFDLTPVAVGSHRFCDLRLYQILEFISLLEPPEVPDMWLLAHYKVPLKEKYHSFDDHGRHGAAANKGHSGDQISFDIAPPSAADMSLSERYPRLSPSQVSFCRGAIESIVIQYCGWNDEALEKVRTEKVAELDSLYGVGFGDALYEECLECILSLFDSATLEMSKRAWKIPSREE